MAADRRPEAVLVSPYRRAIQTATLIRDAGGINADTPLCGDERLREKEFGILDGLTTMGVVSVFLTRLSSAGRSGNSITGHPVARAGPT